VDHGDVAAEFSSEPSRHPGGMEAGDSVRAIPDTDLCQRAPPH
jgi:hypothetical protein